MNYMENHLHHKSLALIHDIRGWTIGEQLRQLKQELKRYNPNQPRVPAGNTDGGQWTSGEGGDSGFVADQPKNPNERIEENPQTPQLDPFEILKPLLSQIGANITKPAKLPPLSAVGGADNEPVWTGDPNNGQADPAYPIEALLGFALGGLFNAISSVGRLLGGISGQPNNVDSTWTLGGHKSPATWNNQMSGRGWTSDQITNTIQNGSQYPAPNNISPSNGATRFEYNGNYVVRDNRTNEILQLGRPDFGRVKLP